MADAYQKACYPGSTTTLADMVTLVGGPSVTILNTHPTEPLHVGGSATVAATTGFRIAAGKALSIVLSGSTEYVFGISGTSTVTVTAAVFRTNTFNPASFG